MNKATFMILAATAVVSCGPKGDSQLGKDSLDKVIAAMTIEEKAHLIIGTGMSGNTGDDPVIGMTQNIVPGAAAHMVCASHALACLL